MRRLFILCSTMLVAVVSTAQTTSLTFDDALALSFEQNPAIVASNYARKAAHRERQAAIGLFMPRISVKGAYAHLNKDVDIDLNQMLSPLLPILGGGLSSLGLDLSYTLQKRNVAMLGGDVVMPIFAGGKVWTANRAAKINEQRVAFEDRRIRGALVVEVVERYFGVSLARRVVAIRQDAVNAVKQHLQEVALLEREGMAVESERLYAEYRLAEAERELRRAELSCRTAEKALQTSLGVEEDIVPATPLFLISDIEPLDYFIASAKLQNPQLGEVASLRELARANLRLHRADYFPEIVAMGSAVFCHHQLSSLVPRMAVGVGLNFKIFDGLNREYKASATRLQLRRVEALERKAEQDISLLVEQRYNSVVALLASVASVSRSEHFAEEFLRAKRVAYREGMATAIEVVDATLNMMRSRVEMAQTAYEVDVALVQLLNAAGLSEGFVRYMHRATSQQIF